MGTVTVLAARDDRLRRGLVLALLLVMAWALLSPKAVSAYAGLGGYISEKLLGSAGNSASLYLGNSASGPVVLASVPFIATLPATNAVFAAGGATATLRGSLANLNGMPNADVWFQWGYTPTTMGTSTARVTETTTGVKTATLTGYNPGLRVYYRFVASTDGVAVGGATSFIARDGRGIAYWLLTNLLTLVIAAGIFITILLLAGNLLLALVSAVAGLIGIQIVLAILESQF